jgi:hypothetical protein
LGIRALPECLLCRRGFKRLKFHNQISKTILYFKKNGEKMLINIETDVFFISQRLREIDENYFIKYNTITKKFEIHHKEQMKNSFCLSVPYNTLDERTLELVNKTRIENIDKLIEKMDKENLIRERQNNKQTTEKLKEVLK